METSALAANWDSSTINSRDNNFFIRIMVLVPPEPLEFGVKVLVVQKRRDLVCPPRDNALSSR